MTFRVVHINSSKTKRSTAPLPPKVFYIGRSCHGHTASPLANPFTVEEFGRDGAIERYKHWIRLKYICCPKVQDEIHLIIEQAQRYDINIACWCYPKRCHGHELVKFIIRIMHNRKLTIARAASLFDSEAWHL